MMHIARPNVVQAPYCIAQVGQPLRAVGAAGGAVDDGLRYGAKVVAAHGVGRGDGVQSDGGDAAEDGLLAGTRAVVAMMMTMMMVMMMMVTIVMITTRCPPRSPPWKRRPPPLLPR